IPGTSPGMTRVAAVGVARLEATGEHSVTKKATHGNSAPAREITDALRQQVRKELPELAQISDPVLQEKAVEAWAYALAHSSFKSIHDIPPAGNPDVNEAKRGDQTDHLRGVTRL